MSGVQTTHPEYDEMKTEWMLVNACCSGSREVKKLGTEFVPSPGSKTQANGEVIYDKARYKSYLTRAIYTNITGRTLTGLTGAAFRVAPKISMPAELEYLNVDADGEGQSITQMAKDLFSCLLTDGRQGLMVDYPEAPEGLTAEQVALLDLKATIKRYGALDVINWRVGVSGGKQRLELVVLRESYNASDYEFGHDQKYQYRVLRIDESGAYSQQLYRNGIAVSEPRYPKDSNGKVFSFIPFFIVGSQSNNASVDPVPLADIAYVNIGHFINSADLEENAHVHGQLTLGITSSLDSDTWKAMNPSGVVVGSQAGHFLGENGGFTSVQAEPNQLCDKLQERKEAKMLSLGARLVEQRNPNETAAAAKIDATGENSVIADLVGNEEEGFLRSIEWCGMFMGVNTEKDDIFVMNRQFFEDEKMTPEEIMAQMAMWQGGVTSKAALDQKLLEGKAFPEGIDLEEMNAAIENELPSMGLDDTTRNSERPINQDS